jgi:phage replication initiation protein
MRNSSEKECPRTTNRGALNTEVREMSDLQRIYITDYAEKGTLKVLIDWCQFTVPLLVDLESVFSDILGISKTEFTQLETDKKVLGYDTCYRNGHIVVLTGGTAEMGHHVQMSGQGCREYEGYCGDNWKLLFERVLKVSGGFSRLDTAIDDFKGYFMIPSLIEKIKRGELSSKFRNAQRIEDILIKDGSVQGNTIRFGRASSRIFVQMYEKNYEQELQGHIDVWNRTEIRMRNERADIFADKYVKDGFELGYLIMGILRNYLTFKDPVDNDTNKARWPVSQFWLDFLNDAEKLRLTTKKPDRSVVRLENWMRHQGSKTLAILQITKPHEFNEMVMEGMEKLTEKDEQLINDYLKECEVIENVLKIKREQKRKTLREQGQLTKNKSY